jgi:hypothetical protein
MTTRNVYLDVADAANPKMRNRKAIVRSGGEMRVLRRYHLLAEKIEALRAESKRLNRFVSPYGPNRLYTSIVDSLIACGENLYHPVSAVYSSFKSVTSDVRTIRNGQTAWDRYNAKNPRNETTHLSSFPRFIYNLEVLQRLGGDHPYGLKLAQMGACIDINLDSTGMIMVRLRTGISDGQEVCPINTNRKRKIAKTVSSVPAGLILDVGSDQEADEPDELN